MKESELRQAYVNKLVSWLGYSEANGKHKQIIDLYNSHTPLARGYKVQYTDAWCATTVSAAAVALGITDIMPTECGCGKMIDLYKKLGRWVENDSYTPNVGDLVMYDWDDSGVGDNLGTPDHVGAVVSVNNGVIRVIEGNKSDSVGYRDIKVNGKFIRGFCTPDFATKAKTMYIKVAETPTATAVAKETLVTVKLPMIKKGSKGNSVKVLQQLLKMNGFDPNGIDGDFGLNTETSLVAYQKANCLVADAICGNATWTKILN